MKERCVWKACKASHLNIAAGLESDATPLILSTMPELPDITIYIEALERRIVGEILEQVRLANPFLLRTAVPPIQAVNGKRVRSLRRLGKRIAFGLEEEYWLVLHLMIAGRLHWRQRGVKLAGKQKLGALAFSNWSV